MECSRPLIFPASPGEKISSHKEEMRGDSPIKGSQGRYASPPPPQPHDLDFPPFDEVAGHKLLGSRDSLVAAAPSGRSEQNRLNPPPLTVNDASEGIFLFVVK